jgi:hypothetical protein
MTSIEKPLRKKIIGHTKNVFWQNVVFNAFFKSPLPPIRFSIGRLKCMLEGWLWLNPFSYMAYD